MVLEMDGCGLHYSYSKQAIHLYKSTMGTSAEDELAHMEKLLANGVAQRISLRTLAEASPCAQRNAQTAVLSLLQQVRAEGVKLLALSDAARLKLSGWDSDWLYGEIDAIAAKELVMNELLPLLRSDAQHDMQNRVFADVGCGSGKALIGAALSCAFSRCVGVEALPSLATLAQMMVGDFEAEVLHKHFNPGHSVHMQVEHGDAIGAGIASCDAPPALEHWVQHADIVLCNCATWNADTVSAIARVCGTGLQRGAVVCSVLAELDHEALSLLHIAHVKATWGDAEACIYQKM